jgi:hypothetical protein
MTQSDLPVSKLLAMPITALLQTYARRIRELRQANADVPETALAPAFQQLLEALFPLLPPGKARLDDPLEHATKNISLAETLVPGAREC